MTKEGQTTIPKELREKYNLEPGDDVIWTDTDEGIVVTKRTQTSGRGLLVPDDITEAKREAVAEELKDHIRDRRDRNDQEA
ncbi:AbrB/MazE/SpoVT family DNA-binding domain-containing protein [Halobacterium hubeiense]|uniref:AbrB/MazE/SpoVT family DNA-binding domain-containing protein n=1 Tax=Halobacterium hubeiense TaxID=1407499 RepID=UPI003C756B57